MVRGICFLSVCLCRNALVCLSFVFRELDFFMKLPRRRLKGLRPRIDQEAALRLHDDCIRWVDTLPFFSPTNRSTSMLRTFALPTPCLLRQDCQ
jgi:hypothetical protein